MKDERRETRNERRKMRPGIILFTFCVLLFSSNVFAQAGYDINVQIGSTTYLQWKVAGDFTAYDSLHFVVKPCTTSSSCGQLIKRNCGVTYSNPYTTLSCTLYVEDTDDFNAAKYFYSIYAYGNDTVAVRSGLLNLQLNGQTPIDGVASTSPIYTIAIDSSSKEPAIYGFRNSDNSVEQYTFDELADSLGVDSLFTKTDWFVRVEEFGAVGDGVTDDFAAIQEAIDSAAGETLIIGASRDDIYLISQPIYLASNSNYIINGTIKIQDGDSTELAIDADSLANSFRVADPSIFEVGQWVGVSSGDGGNFGYDKFWATTGKIIDISGDVITFSEQLVYNYEAADNGRVGHVQGAVALDGLENVTITGSGLIDGNKDNQINFHPIQVGISEQQEAAIPLLVYNSDNISVSGITIRDGLMHSVGVTTAGGAARCDYIKLDDLEVIGGEEKNILIRFTNDVWVTNTLCDSAIWEDGLNFYGTVERAFVSNVRLTNNGRWGLGWNSAASHYLTGDNIYTSNSGDWGVFLSSSNVGLTNLLLNGDGMSISNTYSNAYDINLCNVVIQDAGDPALYLFGAVDRVNICNLIIEGCTGDAIRTFYSSGTARNTSIIGGGIYNHTGVLFDYGDSTDISYYAFNPVYDPDYAVIDDSTQWVWMGDFGKTLDGDSVIVWADSIGGYELAISTDSTGKQPLNGSNYVLFDGNDFLSITTPAVEQDIPNLDFTISGSAVSDAATLGVLASKYISSTNNWQLYYTDGVLVFQASSGGATKILAQTTSGYIDEGSDFWFTVSVDRDGDAQFYINGNQVTTTTTTMTTGAYTYDTTFNMGRQRSPSDVSSGFLDGKVYWLQFDNGLRDADWAFNFFWYNRFIWRDDL